MGFECAHCFTDAVLDGCRWLQRQQALQLVALLGTRSDVELARRAAADAGLGFGVRFETVSSWVRSLWELLGDGRTVVDGALREILVRRLLRQSAGRPACAASEVDSTVSVVAQGVLPTLLATGVEPAESLGLSSRELDALGYAREYRSALEGEALVDLSDAAALVASDDRLECCVAVIGSFATSAGQQHFLDRLEARWPVARFPYGYESPIPSPRRASELQQLLGRLYASAPTPPVRPGGAVRFLLPSGDYASARLVAECILDYLGERSGAKTGTARVVVAAKDPMAMHRRLVPWLNQADPAVSCALSEVQAFEDTAFGRGFLALLDFATERPCSLEAASDFALSPLSGASLFDASKLDARWRADRLADREAVIGDLVGCNPDLQPLFACLSAGDYGGALAVLRSVARLDASGSTAHRRSMAAACSSAESFFSLCEDAKADPLCCIDLLRRVKVGFSGCSGGEGAADDPAVVVTSLKQASAMAPCSRGMLVLCDMSASSYPVKASEDSVSLLTEKLGLRQNRPDALGEHRRMVFRALETACDRVVLERPRFDQSASESYPSVSWEEIADGYRPMGFELEDGEVALFADDKATGLPRVLGPFCRGAVEESLTGYAYGTAQDAGLALHVLPQRDSFSLVDTDRAPSALCPVGPDGTFLLSPSAIETYLECPAKWFSERRLRLGSLDAEFGARETGTFAHDVLRRTFERLGSQGICAVDGESLPAARRVLQEVFDERLAAQAALGPSDCPLIALDSLEREEVELLRRRLLSYLEREAGMLPGFAARYFELPFGTEEPFTYAGCLIRGSIDRVDVNERGQAVVIDYKSSAKPEHCLASCSPFATAAGGTEAQGGELVLPHRVQALVYAQVVRRMTGLDVVGALYVPYGKPAGRACAVGAYDPQAIGEADIPGVKGAECGVFGDVAEAFEVAGFHELLDEVERRIEVALRGMRAGDVAPRPRGGAPCSWCSFLSCPERG